MLIKSRLICAFNETDHMHADLSKKL